MWHNSCLKTYLDFCPIVHLVVSIFPSACLVNIYCLFICGSTNQKKKKCLLKIKTAFLPPPLSPFYPIVFFLLLHYSAHSLYSSMTDCAVSNPFVIHNFFSIEKYFSQLLVLVFSLFPSPLKSYPTQLVS